MSLKSAMTIFFSLLFIGLQAQTGKHLDQEALMKQFIGTWKTDIPGDTSSLYIVITPFGKTFTANAKLIKKGKTVNEGKWLWGYNRDENVFIAAEVSDKSPGMNLFAYSFVAENIVEKFAFADIGNTERPSLANKFEFRTPDLIIQTLSRNDKTINTFTINRVKE